MKENYMRFRCDDDFKSLVEILAARENRTFSSYITNLLKGEIKKMKNLGKEVLTQAKSLNQFVTCLPDVEIGETVEMNSIWDGEGEVPESSYSYLLTNDGMEGEGNCPIWINYEFEIVEQKDNPLKTIIRITDIELL
jgi:hypothetical protein